MAHLPSLVSLCEMWLALEVSSLAVLWRTGRAGWRLHSECEVITQTSEGLDTRARPELLASTFNALDLDRSGESSYEEVV